MATTIMDEKKQCQIGAADLAPRATEEKLEGFFMEGAMSTTTTKRTTEMDRIWLDEAALDAAYAEMRKRDLWLDCLHKTLTDVRDSAAEGELTDQEHDALHDLAERLEHEVNGITERLAEEAGLLAVSA